MTPDEERLLSDSARLWEISPSELRADIAESGKTFAAALRNAILFEVDFQRKRALLAHRPKRNRPNLP